MDDDERIIGRVYWNEQMPYFYGTYYGATKSGDSCKIECDNRTKVYVDGKQVGSDKIEYWYLKVKHLKSFANIGKG